MFPLIPLTREAEAVLRAAAGVASDRGQHWLGSDHLLLALLQGGGSGSTTNAGSQPPG